MKFSNILPYLACISASIFMLSSCSDGNNEEEASEAVTPVVSYSNPDSFETYVNEPTELNAEITSPGPVECTWTVDGEPIAATPSTVYSFPEKKSYLVVFTAFNSAGNAQKEFTVNVIGHKLNVDFSSSDDFTIREDGSVEIQATVTDGDLDVNHEWLVSGVDAPVSTTSDFSYTFTVSGEYTITYNGVNADDETFTKTWKVTVLPKPLLVEFSVTDAQISRKQGEPVFINSTAKYGGAGLTQEWKVDDATVETESLFGYLFNEAGNHTISYYGKNSLGETYEHSWTVAVSVQESIFVETFESDEIGFRPTVANSFIKLKSGYSIATNNDNGSDSNNKRILAISIQANPSSGNINSSGKVLSDDMSKSSSTGTSGVFNYRFADMEDRESVVAIRMKVYMGNGDYYPWMTLSISGEPKRLPSRVNGVDFNPKTGTKEQFDALWVKGAWNVVEYNLSTCYGQANLSNCVQFQPRPFINFKNQNSSGKADPETNSRVAFFDDFEFLK